MRMFKSIRLNFPNDNRVLYYNQTDSLISKGNIYSAIQNEEFYTSEKSVEFE